MVRSRAPGASVIKTAVLCAFVSVPVGGRAVSATSPLCCASNACRRQLFFSASQFLRHTTHNNWLHPLRSLQHATFCSSGLTAIAAQVRPPPTSLTRLSASLRSTHDSGEGFMTSLSMSSCSSSWPATAPTKQHRNGFLCRDNGRPSGSRGGAAAGSPPTLDTDGPLALVVLNTKGDSESKQLLRHLWARAVLRVCADGGANRLYDSFNKDDNTADSCRARFVPDVIVGDLDSLRPEVEEFYKGMGTEVKRHVDQDYNDFEKCLLEIERRLGSMGAIEAPLPSTAREGGGEGSAGGDEGGHATDEERDGGREPTPGAATTGETVCAATVVGLGAFGGRFDHEMAAMSLLHAYTARFARLVLMGAGNVAFLLEPGVKHFVRPDSKFEGPTVGLIPVGGPCRSVTTEGLKWNLQEGALEFGVLISSSNCVEGKEVTVVTDAPLVWTAEFKTADWVKSVAAVTREDW